MNRILTLLFTGLSFLSYAQKEMNEAWLIIPEGLKKDANAIVRNYETEYFLKSSNNLEVKISYAITILDNEGKSHATQVLNYDVFSKITSGEIIIYDKEGKLIKKIGLKDMKDYGTSGLENFFDDSRLKIYEPEVKETPYTIVFNYSEKFSDFFQLPGWYPQSSSDIAVEQASLTIHNPLNIQYKIKQNNLNKDNYSHLDTLLYRRWKMRDIKAFKPESFVKSSQLPSVSLSMKQFQVQGFEGNTDSWQSFGKWSADLIAGRDILPEETTKKILDMVKDIVDPLERAKIIYAWMQENTRYISIQYGIGGWQPFPASEVDELKYGDCKGLANYTKSLLAVAGIDSYYTLIYAGAGKKNIDPDFPSNQFNHIILCIPFKNDTTWAECTADNFALGYLGDFTDDRYALVINGDQSKLVKTIRYPKEENLQIRNGMMTVNKDGSTTANIKTSYSGIQFKNRSDQIKKNDTERKDYLYNAIDIPGFTLKRAGYDYIKEAKPILKEDIDLDIPKSASITGNRMFIPLNLMNKYDYKPEKDTARINTIFVNMAYIDIDSLVYEIPAGYEIERLPEASAFESVYGKFSFSASVKGNQILYVRKLEQNSGEFPANGWSDFRKYRLNIVKADKATAILKKVAI